ncbi:MAG: 2-C-methyl-D-erythritol 2,4-cyclodiphosphate synthase [Candidatus Omnitrophica bacterium]|nr:2-C-methyl-D-erythritol 2,4-cyclodiphosphate synthase [Candidatus Omnitrophota bacterium]
MSYRIGMGYDIHRLTEGRKLFIGGFEVPYFKGLLGHSDGDVLLHAICDAMLGAISEGDIGAHFPDTEPKFQGIASAELLIKVYELVKNKGYKVVNIDTVIIAQEPVLAPFKKNIQNSIAEILDIKTEFISVKAKTNEGLGDIGKKEAIATYTVVLLTKEAKGE